jgi:biopolymer transport protein TolR
MAIDVGNGGSAVSGRHYKRVAQISQINVTPMVDVMLVLLVVFMITAPLLTVGVPIDLPKTEAGRIVGQDEPLVISMNGAGKLFLQDTEITLDQLVPRLLAISQNKRDTRIFLRADQTIPYGQVMQVMGAMNQAGFSRVALITELPNAPAAKAGGGK